MTIAYIAIGAHLALRAFGGRFDPDVWEGEIGYYDAVIQHAEDLDEAGEEWGDGVWAYEVAEPFGQAYGEAILEAGYVLPAAPFIARAVGRE
jgi:hypothetical protein